MSGWIKLRRTLKDWEWYNDHNATRLLIHLLLSVNYEDKKWRGIIVKAGSLIYSWETLSKSCLLSVKQCRVAMKKLESSGEVTRKVASKYQVVSLVKWDKMQVKDVTEGRQRAGKGQDEGRMRATTKEDKEIKEEKEDDGKANPTSFYDISICKDYYLKNDKVLKAVSDNPKNNITFDEITNRIEKFNKHLLEISETTKQYKDYCKHFLNWNLKQKENGETTEQAIERARKGLIKNG